MSLFGISGELFLALAGMVALLTSVFINKDNTLILVIPIAIILAFSAKGISLYFAKLLMKF